METSNRMKKMTMPLAMLAVAVVALAVLFQGFGANPVAAQVAAQTQTQTITVNAVGEAAAKPDMATISVGVVGDGPTAKAALDAHSAQVVAVMAKLKELKIADSSVQTVGFGLYQDYDKEGVASSYKASSNLDVKVQDINRTGEILDALVGAGANSAGGITFGLKDDKALQAQALTTAVANARPKADAIAKQLGVRITGVSSVVEGSYGDAMPMASKVATDAAGNVPIAQGELSVQSNVTMVFTYSK